MLTEAAAITFLAFWVSSEYTSNTYFQTYANALINQYLTTYLPLMGLLIGASGSIVALRLWKSLRDANPALKPGTKPKVRQAE